MRKKEKEMRSDQALPLLFFWCDQANWAQWYIAQFALSQSIVCSQPMLETYDQRQQWQLHTKAADLAYKKQVYAKVLTLAQDSTQQRQQQQQHRFSAENIVRIQSVDVVVPGRKAQLDKMARKGGKSSSLLASPSLLGYNRYSGS